MCHHIRFQFALPHDTFFLLHNHPPMRISKFILETEQRYCTNDDHVTSSSSAQQMYLVCIHGTTTLMMHALRQSRIASHRLVVFPIPNHMWCGGDGDLRFAGEMGPNFPKIYRHLYILHTQTKTYQPFISSRHAHMMMIITSS